MKCTQALLVIIGLLAGLQPVVAGSYSTQVATSNSGEHFSQIDGLEKHYEDMVPGCLAPHHPLPPATEHFEAMPFKQDA